MKNRRLAAAVAIGILGVMAVAPMAAAHVTVNPGEAEKGGFASLTFRVPNERDDATTTSLEVNFPEEHPFTSVRVKPTPGWQYEIEMRTLDEPLDNHGEEVTEVVSKITWSGGEIGTTEFQEFSVSAGRMPEDVDQIMFPSIQTYSGGEVVRWIDEVVEGEEEPEHPAPTLKLIDPVEEGEEAPADEGGDGSEGESAGGVTVENAASQDDVDSANTMATVGIVVGVLGLLVGGFALFTSRKRSA